MITPVSGANFVLFAAGLDGTYYGFNVVSPISGATIQPYTSYSYKNGVTTDISISGAYGTQVLGSDDQGDYFGAVFYSVPGNPIESKGFYHSNGATYVVDLGVGGQLFGVNHSGVAVGYFSDTSGLSHGAIFRNGTLTQFDVPGAADTAIYGMNDQGDFVGEYLDASAQTHGFVDIGGQLQTLDYPNSGGTVVSSINDADIVVGSYTSSSNTSASFEASPACFLRGTRIRLATGETAVEDLRVGDPVVTASGELKPIKWLGRRRLACDRHPNPEAIWPIRVVAGAFAPDAPTRDLWLSPAHAVRIGDALTPISALQNGRTIAQALLARIEYWHVELDDHDVLFAEGLACESYLDTGNRRAFENGGALVEAHPDFRPRHWSQTCLPLRFDGPQLAAAKAATLERAAWLGNGLGDDAEPNIVVDGRPVAPAKRSTWRLEFDLPEGGRNLVLRSRTFIPAHTLDESADVRTLGLCVAELRLDGEAMSLEGEAALAGWEGAESVGGRFSHRWTTGETPLPAGVRHVAIDLAGHGRYWLDPPAQGERAA